MWTCGPKRCPICSDVSSASVDDEGTVVDKTPGRAEHATVERGWLLFLRRRVPDSQGFLDEMRDLYARDHPVPEPLLRARRTR